MKKIFATAALAAVAVASPALAQDAVGGAHVGVEIGLVDDDFLGSEDTSYGVTAGYDIPLGGVVAGPVVGYTGLFDDNGSDFREYSIGGRLGVPLDAGTLFYGSVAYSNIDADGFPGSLDGAKFGVGFEKNFGGFYGRIETRYADYEAGAELYQTVLGAGVKF